MATNANQLAKSGKFGDLRRRLVFLLLALVVYRRGAHIIDPRTGQPAEDVISSTVMADDPSTAGALATAFTVLHPDGALFLARCV